MPAPDPPGQAAPAEQASLALLCASTDPAELALPLPSFQPSAGHISFLIFARPGRPLFPVSRKAAAGPRKLPRPLS